MFNDNSYVVIYDLALEDAINENPKKRKLYEGEQKSFKMGTNNTKATKVTFDVGAFIAISANEVTTIDNVHNGFSSIYILSKRGRRTPSSCVLRLLVCSIHLKKKFLNFKMFFVNLVD